MNQFYEMHDHNFEAEITIYPLGPETRTSHPLNGIRWAFAYADDLKNDGALIQISDVWPEFIDDGGETIARDVPLMGTLRARMHIVFPKMVKVHLKRLKVGTKFYCMEGARKCAEGIVTALRRDE